MKNDFDELIQNHDLVLVDFFASWCAPCKEIPLVLNEVKSMLGDSIQIIEIDVDLNKTLIERYAVRGVPMLVLFKKGEIVWKHYSLIGSRELIQAISQFDGLVFDQKIG
jgi:thioredoxin 1